MIFNSLHPFDFGLSYIDFEYSDLNISARQVDSRGQVTISCHIRNIGPVAGDEVAQLYSHDRVATILWRAVGILFTSFRTSFQEDLQNDNFMFLSSQKGALAVGFFRMIMVLFLVDAGCFYMPENNDCVI